MTALVGCKFEAESTILMRVSISRIVIISLLTTAAIFIVSWAFVGTAAVKNKEIEIRKPGKN